MTIDFSSHRVLVLGSASWLGYLLLNRLHEVDPKVQLAGTFHLQQVDFKFELPLYKVGALKDYEAALQDFAPTVIVNFLRGEDFAGVATHKYVVNYCQNNSCYYLFASSALALDGYRERELTENMVANSSTPYGSFKAQCEFELYASAARWCIVRFASVQGWAPHKITRNESFLRKLSVGERIIVDRGVVQNRMLADFVVNGYVGLIEKQVEGIIHFGAVDSSEEFEYLKRQAECFGYDKNLIHSGNDRHVNLVTIPARIFQLFGNCYRVTEHQTLTRLLQIPGLQQYKIN